MASCIPRIFSGTTHSQKRVTCEYSHFSLFVAAWVVSPRVTPSLQAKLPYSGKKRGVTAVHDDWDGNENGKNAIDLISKATTLHVHHTFLYLSLTSLHDYDVKMPNFSFYGSFMEDVDKRRRIFLSLSELECGPQEINSREIDLHLTFSVNWN